MPKRSHPDDAPVSPQQLKTHVGQKEVNEGVNKEENMKAVYDKTLNMMMEGAKKVAEQEKEAEKEVEMTEENGTKHDTEPDVTKGQTYLSTEGTLKVAGVYDEAEESGDSKKEEVKDDEMKEVKEDEKKEENGDGDKPTNGTHKEDEKSDDAEEEEKPVQKTTLSDVGFKIDGVKSTSPSGSPLKSDTAAKRSPVKLVKKPLDQ